MFFVCFGVGCLVFNEVPVDYMGCRKTWAAGGASCMPIIASLGGAAKPRGSRHTFRSTTGPDRGACKVFCAMHKHTYRELAFQFCKPISAVQICIVCQVHLSEYAVFVAALIATLTELCVIHGMICSDAHLVAMPASDCHSHCSWTCAVLYCFLQHSPRMVHEYTRRWL